jgi:voltage-gated potassium channel Kch
MLHQLLLGALLIAITLGIQVLVISTAIAALTKVGKWFATPPLFIKNSLALIGTTLWLILGLSLSAAIWALTFISVGAFEEFESALYFSIVTFTTLGYGDIFLSEDWRLLSSITAVNGLLMFGLNTAFLVEFFRRLLEAQQE